MKSPAQPKWVPLPKVSEHTDRLVFNNLGLPVGFDGDRLLCNLQAFRAVRIAGGLGSVSICSEEGAAEEQDIRIASLNPHGVATAAGVGGRRPRPSLVSGTVEFPYPAFMGSPDATILCNRTEMNARLGDTSAHSGGLFDYHAQAELLNKAVKLGLLSASAHASFRSITSVGAFSAYYGFIASYGLAGPHTIKAPPEVLLPVLLVSAPLVETLTSLGQAARFGVGGVKDVLGFVRWSVFMGCAPDRLLAAAGVIAASKYIKARP